MKEYTFELETTGKCEVIVRADNDKDAVKQLFERKFYSKNQIESNLEMPNTNIDNMSELMDYCSGSEEILEEQETIEEMAEEKLTVAPVEVMVEKPLVVPTEGFKINLNGKVVFIKKKEVCYQDFIIEAKGKYTNSETYTVTYKHTQRHTDLGFELEGSLKNNMFLKINNGLVVNVQIT